MVAVSPRAGPKGRGNSILCYLLFAGAVLITIVPFSSEDAIIADLLQFGELVGVYGIKTLSSNSIETDSRRAFVVSNQQIMKEWRHKRRDQCQKASSEADVSVVQQKIIQQDFVVPPEIGQQRHGDDDRKVQWCNSVVLDFGANIGDTLGHLIDSGMMVCDRSEGSGTKSSYLHFDVSTKRLGSSKKLNPLTFMLVKVLGEMGDRVGPEDYCYYGIEGNPVFTDRLRDLEDSIMSIRPRPVQHIHFLTNSVGAGVDGPTKLYLDTVNARRNFWGSSIFEGHRDVQKSAQAAKTTVDKIAADVMGYTIGTLLRKTLIAFNPKAGPAEKKDNHLVLKIDIEGAEYPLLFQAAQEGTLCEFVKMGNRVDIFVEFHNTKVMGKPEYEAKTKEMKGQLEQCGVKFYTLEGTWK